MLDEEDEELKEFLEEFGECALPLNAVILAIADLILSEENLTDEDRKTAAVVLNLVAQKMESSSEPEMQPRLQH